MKQFDAMERGRLEELLSGLGTVRVGIVGDFCLDIYWHADMTKSELSRETPHFPLPIVKERIYPGAAGNAAANLAALEPACVKACGLIGDDWRGGLLRRELQNRGIDDAGILTVGGRFTNAYCKPLRKGISETVYEDPRLDFICSDEPDRDSEDRILAWIDTHIGDLDVLCVSDQLTGGVVTRKVREHLCELGSQGHRIVADSRNDIAQFRNVILKPNEVEGWRAVNPYSTAVDIALPEYIEAAQTLSNRTGSAVMMTLGSKGSVYTYGCDSVLIPCNPLVGETDICGAGDSFLSAFAALLAVGARPEEAAFAATLASEVCIQKIGVTGTAAREEILARFGTVTKAASEKK